MIARLHFLILNFHFFPDKTERTKQENLPPKDVPHEGVVQADGGLDCAKGHHDDGEEGEEALKTPKDSIEGEIEVPSCFVCVRCPKVSKYDLNAGTTTIPYCDKKYLFYSQHLSSDQTESRILEDTEET